MKVSINKQKSREYPMKITMSFWLPNHNLHSLINRKANKR